MSDTAVVTIVTELAFYSGVELVVWIMTTVSALLIARRLAI